MGTTADKLQAILNNKNDIKAAIEEKGVSDVGDVLSTYADKIRSISTGGGSGETKWTGHADVEGLKAIGWTDEDIEYYQNNGVNWNEEDDEYHKVPQDNIALYGVINATNIKRYSDILVYLPKIDTSGITNMNRMFEGCSSLVFIPLLDTSAVTNMMNMFQYCPALVSIPVLNTSRVINMCQMFNNCYSLVNIPLLDTSKVTDMSTMFQSCYSLVSIPLLDTSAVTNMMSMFNQCFTLVNIPVLNTSKVTNMEIMFSTCYSLVSIPLLDISSVSRLSEIFNGCFSLQIANLSGLKLSLSLNRTSLLAKESLLYIIQNSAATSKITITLSSYTYSKLASDPDIEAALEAKPNVLLVQ